MRDSDLLRVLRTLTDAAARFEKGAAKHQRIEAERKALQEALTDAQLVLSVQQWKPLAEVRRLNIPKRLEVSATRRNGGARRKPKGKDHPS